MNLVSAIDSSVGKFPDKPMIVAGDRSFTYAEAAELSRHAAGWLAEQGIGEGDAVVTAPHAACRFFMSRVSCAPSAASRAASAFSSPRAIFCVPVSGRASTKATQPGAL